MNRRSKVKKFLAVLGLIGALALGAVPSAQAAVQVLSLGCGSGNPKTGDNTTYVDTTGNLCTSGGGALPTGVSTAANQNATAAGTSATNAQAVQGVTGGVALPVSIATPPTPTKQTPAAGSSFSIVTGGTAQNVFAANSIVTQGLIVNPKNATESLFIDLVNPAQNVQGGGTNGTSIELSPGQSFSCPPSTLPVSVNAVTAGHTFIAVRF